MAAMKKLLISTFVVVTPVYAVLEHDRAVYAAQNNEWDKALGFMIDAVAAHHDDPRVLYDAGVASFKAGDYAQAQAYFTRAAAHQSADQILQERALSNSGDTYVKQNELESAIKVYEQALKIDPTDRRTQHNLDVVKKMLEQQKQQQKKDEKDKQNRDKKQENNNKDQNSKDDTSGDDQKNSHDNERTKNQEKNAQQQGDKQQSHQQQSDTSDQKQQERKQRANDQQKQTAESLASSAKNRHEHSNQQPQERPGQSESLKTAERSQENDAHKQAIARVLQEQEHNDAHLNKQMIKAMVNKQLAGRNEQNCW
jgi:Ca-activated chloride channel family protein